MKRIGVVAGSFDPITNGHVWLINEAAKVVDKLYVVVGSNPAKKYMFSVEDRLEFIGSAIEDLDHRNIAEIRCVIATDRMLVDVAADLKATHLIRGIRSLKDYEYELDMVRFNRDIAPDIETLFFLPPDKYSQISSSTVKGLVGFDKWEERIGKYVHPRIVNAFNQQRGS